MLKPGTLNEPGIRRMDSEYEQKASPETVNASKESPAASRITDDIRERMSSLQPEAADRAQQAANAARQAAANLRGQEEWMALLIEQGAEKLSGLADMLRSNDAGALLRKTQEFARRQPVLFAGGALALGFALTRATAAATRGNATHLQERADASD